MRRSHGTDRAIGNQQRNAIGGLNREAERRIVRDDDVRARAGGRRRRLSGPPHSHSVAVHLIKADEVLRVEPE